MPVLGWADHPPSPKDTRRLSLDPELQPTQPPNEHATPNEHRSPSPESVIDPALRTALPSTHNSDKKDPILPEESTFTSANHRIEGSRHLQESNNSVPHRVEPFVMSSSHRRQYFDNSNRLPSPPPTIATIPHSQSPSPSVASVDRSSVSTPPVRRSPPHNVMPEAPFYQTSYTSDPSMMRSAHQHPSYFSQPREHINHAPPPPYMYQSHPGFEHHRYPDHPDAAISYHQGSVPHYPLPPPPMPYPGAMSYSQQYPIPGVPQSPINVAYTDDASTKLSDRIRRRCFNCCTADTSTWRRSNLSPGKVLCNKCGLFERTHSRSRPEQFPHKRAPIPSSVSRKSPHSPSNQLPPLSPDIKSGDSDRVRRRCFKCSTTDTSAWRRSNVSPGELLCNKCGLVERTQTHKNPVRSPVYNNQ